MLVNKHCIVIATTQTTPPGFNFFRVDMRALAAIRKHCAGAKIETVGLAEKYLRGFERDPSLVAAVTQGRVKHLDPWRASLTCSA